MADVPGGEALLWRAWALRLWDGAALRTTDGHSLHVVYPGRRRGTPGPDFQGAIVVRGDSGRIEHGDVEVHVQSSGWSAHHHAGSAAYTSVILHVVLLDDGGEPPHRADGSLVPTLVLAPYLTPQALHADTAVDARMAEGDDAGSCRVSPEVSSKALLTILEDAGYARLDGRAAVFEADLAMTSTIDAGQVLFRGLLDAAGYSRNREPCRAVADRLSLRVLQTLCARRPMPEATMLAEAIMLGAAGLLAEDDARGHALWEDMPDLWPGSQLHRADWHYAAVRPANRPEARLRGIAVLVARTATDGLLEALLAPLYGPLSPPKMARALLAVLVVHVTDQGRGAASLGAPRATEMLVNVVLPFAMAWAEIHSEPALAGSARRVLSVLPGSQLNEKLTAMQDVVAPTGCQVERLTALRQQGLLHLYERHCAFHDCQSCPLAGGSHQI